MAIPHANPGEVVDVRPLGSALASAQTKTLVRAEQVEVIRLVVPAGAVGADGRAIDAEEFPIDGVGRVGLALQDRQHGIPDAAFTPAVEAVEDAAPVAVASR